MKIDYAIIEKVIQNNTAKVIDTKIGELEVLSKNGMIWDLMGYFSHNDPNFDKKIFVEACGGQWIES